jgi:hypothetical protein
MPDIDSISAVAPSDTVGAQTFKFMPQNLNPSALVKTLGALGLYVPTNVITAAAQGKHLREANHRFSLKEVDAALSKAGVSISDRFKFKAAMTDNAILGA